MKRVLCLLSSGLVIFLITCSPGSAEPTGSETGVQGLLQPETDTAPKSDHFHVLYDSLLKKYVRNGRVDYVGFREAGGHFGLYLKSLGEVREREFTAWSQGQKLAFWINAYSAFTIKAIIVHYPIKTRTIIGLFSPQNSFPQIPGVWNRLRFQAVGKMVTLDEIEHGILRKKFKDPRIHVAIVCASMSCPDLASEAYRADIIRQQLDYQTRKFVNEEKGARIDLANGEISISKIFKWFGEDFVEQFGGTKLFADRSEKDRSVLNFIRTYLEDKRNREFLERNQFKMKYLKYDWSLNDLRA